MCQITAQYKWRKMSSLFLFEYYLMENNHWTNCLEVKCKGRSKRGWLRNNLPISSVSEVNQGYLEMLVNEDPTTAHGSKTGKLYTCVHVYPLSPPWSGRCYGQGYSHLYHGWASGTFKGCFTALLLWSRGCFIAHLVWSRFIRTSWAPEGWCGTGRERMHSYSLLSAVQSSGIS